MEDNCECHFVCYAQSQHLKIRKIICKIYIKSKKNTWRVSCIICYARN